jgi:hypothetical protein
MKMKMVPQELELDKMIWKVLIKMIPNTKILLSKMKVNQLKKVVLLQEKRKKRRVKISLSISQSWMRSQSKS